jgi:hypothetical protein
LIAFFAAEESDPSPILLGKAMELMAGLAGTFFMLIKLEVKVKFF